MPGLPVASFPVLSAAATAPLPERRRLGPLEARGPRHGHRPGRAHLDERELLARIRRDGRRRARRHGRSRTTSLGNRLSADAVAAGALGFEESLVGALDEIG